MFFRLLYVENTGDKEQESGNAESVHSSFSHSIRHRVSRLIIHKKSTFYTPFFIKMKLYFLKTPLFVYRYVCVLKKGYQDTDTVLSSVTTKVKGIALTNTTELGERIWDVADYIIPPQVVRRLDKEEVQARQFICPLAPLRCHHLHGLQRRAIRTCMLAHVCVHCVYSRVRCTF